MISPEILRRYPFFCCLSEEQQKAIAMVTEEMRVDAGKELFLEGHPVEALYLLVEGSVDLFYATGDSKDQLLVGEVNPGEPFAISAMIEPYTFTATARVAAPSRVLRIDGKALRALCEVDCKLGYALVKQVAAMAIERLHFARVQLAAARKSA
ncbi:MAG: Crp/Fnr family transcriptional regulator [Anaerolineales bacterium]|nr:Crp/Fnr family transcriptional regulator [Anaerolineales bacterium]